MGKIYALSFLVLFSASSASSAEIEDLVTQIKNGNHSVVQSQLIPLARQGNARAEFNLGVAYMHGDGVTKNEKKAFIWTKKAAEKGFARAEVNLAGAYQEGKGVKRDYVEALKWYEAAENDPEVGDRAAAEAEKLRERLSKNQNNSRKMMAEVN